MRAGRGTGRGAASPRRLDRRSDDPRLFREIYFPPADVLAVDARAHRRWLEANPEYRTQYNARRRVDHHPRFCPTCHREFKPKRIDSRYCRNACRPSNSWAVRGRATKPNKARRQRILSRDDWRCYLCGGEIPRDLAWPHPRSGTVDHVHPVSAGGPDTDDNLRASHWACNQDKADQLPGVETWVPSEALR